MKGVETWRVISIPVTKKTCSKCKAVKPLAAFARKREKKDSRCRACRAAYHASWYAKNRAKRIKQVAANVKVWRKRTKKWIDSLKSNPCADCQRRFPPCAMDFDHVRGRKAFGIGGACSNRGVSQKRLHTEIAKCEVVCACCHRIRTHERRLKRERKRKFKRPAHSSTVRARA